MGRRAMSCWAMSCWAMSRWVMGYWAMSCWVMSYWAMAFHCSSFVPIGPLHRCAAEPALTTVSLLRSDGHAQRISHSPPEAKVSTVSARWGGNEAGGAGAIPT
jgi:hypothetical protein